MSINGGAEIPLTNNRTGHVDGPEYTPDGKWMAFISFPPEIDPADHPFYKRVLLRLMPLASAGTPRVIAYLYGGQGAINVPSWSPDGKFIAFVSNY